MVSGTPPSTTAMHSGSRYSATVRASAGRRRGASSDGLITAALPAAIAPTSGASSELDRVVPRPDDQHDAERLADDPRACPAAG